MGLTPKGTMEPTGPYDPRPFLQPYPLERDVVRLASLTAAAGSRNIASTTYGTEGMDGHSYYIFGNDGEASGSVVFAGHGVSTDGYDDFAAMADAGIDFTGKWLIFLDAEPMTADGRSLISTDGELTSFSRNFFQKIRQVLQSGQTPAGVLVVGDSDPRGSAHTVAERAAARLDRMGGLSLPALPGAEEERAAPSRPCSPSPPTSRTRCSRAAATPSPTSAMASPRRASPRCSNSTA